MKSLILTAACALVFSGRPSLVSSAESKPSPGAVVQASEGEQTVVRRAPLVHVETRVVSPEWQESQSDAPGEPRVRVFRWSHRLGRGFIGVDVLPLTPELRRHFGVPEDVGVMVSSVREGAPAEVAGILVGDVLSAVDGERVASVNELARLVRAKEDGDVVTVELYRNGGLESYPVTIDERERPAVDFSSGYRFRTEGPNDEAFVTMDGLHLDENAREAMEDAMRELELRFEGDEFQDRLKRLQDLDFGAIQDRMREVEKRLQELEKDLAREREKEKL